MNDATALLDTRKSSYCPGREGARLPDRAVTDDGEGKEAGDSRMQLETLAGYLWCTDEILDKRYRDWPLCRLLKSVLLNEYAGSYPQAPWPTTLPWEE